MIKYMKKNLYLVLCLLAALTLVVSGCKKDKEAEPETFDGNVAAPTWTAPSKYDYNSTMTAVIKVDLKAQYPTIAANWKSSENDLLAAFAGDQLVGLGNQIEAGLYNLMIVDAEGEITLRYYSVYYKNLFEAKDAFPYHKDDRLGTPDNPLVPTFVVVK